MKNIIIKILFIIAILVAISEIKEITIGIILIKIISMTYIYLFLKANNYFN